MPKTDSDKVNASEKAILDAMFDVQSPTELKKEKAAAKKAKRSASSSTSSSGWNTVRLSPDKRSEKDISKWTNTDFFYYVNDKHFSRYGTKIAVSKVYGSGAIAESRRLISKALGKRMPNELVLSYADWFFDIHHKKVVSKSKPFRITMLKWESVMASFIAFLSSRTESQIDKAPAISDGIAKRPREDSLEEAVKLKSVMGSKALILAFGPILAANYLIVSRKHDESSVGTEVLRLTRSLISSDSKNVDTIISSVMRYAPYPPSLKWVEIEQIEKALGREFASRKMLGPNQDLDFLA
jgi:hypothetical protein